MNEARLALATRLLNAIAVLGICSSAAVAQERQDVLIADFEGPNYGAWSATGTAFGSGPARGPLPGQMAVSGFEGKGLVNSFTGGDASKGTLTSPPFKVGRRYINFLLGGGNHPGETCVNLLVGRAVVRTASGPNDQPGGSEQLAWSSWDVSDLLGKEVVLQIVDQHTGGWGHINVDQIVQSDRKRGPDSITRSLTLNARYLHLPVQNDAPSRRLRIMVDGKAVRDFDIKLALDRTDFWTFTDLSSVAGKDLTISAILPEGSKILDPITQSDALPGAVELYRERTRPQFHFTSRRGWLNDPNGLVWFDGEYHLFYQHNPYGWDWGDMHWGHAVSRDLVRWSELPIALYPKQYGDWCFSGSAVVDRSNASGFGTRDKPPLVLAYTSTGRGECIAFSNDRGRTWTEFEGNPVVRHNGRDPRLLWHEKAGRWVMAVYDETGGRQAIHFHSSPDLKLWKYESRIDDFFECPDLFELVVEGEPSRRLWVLLGADGAYRLGQFDGRTFTPETGKQKLWHGDFYASQTWSDTPDGRRIQIGWGRGIAFPGMPFNQQMTIPCELTLRRTTDGIQMFGQPVAELASLRGKSHELRDVDVKAGADLFPAFNGDTFEVEAEVEVGSSGSLTLTLGGAPVTYDATKRTLTCWEISAPLVPEKGIVRLRALVDRGSVEVFANDGRVAISKAIAPPKGSRLFSVLSKGEGTRIRLLKLNELKSAWR